MILGKSVHNQRLECLWKGVFEGVLLLYYKLFYYLESIIMLTPTDNVSLFCLHYVFISLVNLSVTSVNGLPLK